MTTDTVNVQPTSTDLHHHRRLVVLATLVVLLDLTFLVRRVRALRRASRP